MGNIIYTSFLSWILAGLLMTLAFGTYRRSKVLKVDSPLVVRGRELDNFLSLEHISLNLVAWPAVGAVTLVCLWHDWKEKRDTPKESNSTGRPVSTWLDGRRKLMRARAADRRDTEDGHSDPTGDQASQ